MSRTFPRILSICQVAIALWIVGVATLVWFFVQGITKPASDERTAVLLTPSERNVILGEMRQLLQAVDGVLQGLSDPDQNQGKRIAEKAARSGGMSMAADVNPALMLKIPLPMKQIGISVHQDFDKLADAIYQGESSQQLLQRLSSITNRCTACHEMYQLATPN